MILAIIIVILSKAIVSSGSQRVWELENRVVHEILAHVPSCKRDWSNHHHHDDDEEDDDDEDLHHYHLGRGFEVKDQKTVCKRDHKKQIIEKQR